MATQERMQQQRSRAGDNDYLRSSGRPMKRMRRASPQESSWSLSHSATRSQVASFIAANTHRPLLSQHDCFTLPLRHPFPRRLGHRCTLGPSAAELSGQLSQQDKVICFMMFRVVKKVQSDRCAASLCCLDRVDRIDHHVKALSDICVICQTDAMPAEAHRAESAGSSGQDCLFLAAP